MVTIEVAAQSTSSVVQPADSANGNEVIVSGQFRNGRGDRSAANFRIVVDNGRIAVWQVRY